MEDINEKVKQIATDLIAEIETMENTASSGARARKLSSALGKEFVAFRKESVSFHKK